MTSVCPLTVVAVSVDGTGHRHSVATAPNILATDRVSGGAAVVRSTDRGGGGVAAGRGGVAAGAERVGGLGIL